MTDVSRRRPAAFGASAQTATRSDEVDQTERYLALRQRRDQLNDIRIRREGELAAARKVEAQCASEAKALGANSIEELEAMIETQRRQDAEALDKLERELDAQQALLEQVGERVEAAERR